LRLPPAPAAATGETSAPVSRHLPSRRQRLAHRGQCRLGPGTDPPPCPSPPRRRGLLQRARRPGHGARRCR
jgi:hypothetical protein